MIIVVMGPSGVGKTTVGRALAVAAGWTFQDADDLHPAANVAKIRQGIPLTDADRAPWLARIHAALVELASGGSSAVLACSALRGRYRAQLAAGVPEVRWVLLRAAREVLRDRLIRRPGHFAGTAILESQLEALEPPADALVVDTGRPVELVVADICAALNLSCDHTG